MNPRYGTQNLRLPTSWNTVRIDSGSRVLYAPYLCQSLIYCLTHVECFRFFLTANIVAAPELRTTSAVYKQRAYMASVCVLHITKKRSGSIVMSHTWLEKSPGLKQVRSSLRPACDTLTQDCDQVFDQVCRWLE